MLTATVITVMCTLAYVMVALLLPYDDKMTVEVYRHIPDSHRRDQERWIKEYMTAWLRREEEQVERIWPVEKMTVSWNIDGQN